jgi:hypothetical protein
VNGETAKLIIQESKEFVSEIKEWLTDPDR